jgi:hypothetical protein
MTDTEYTTLTRARAIELAANMIELAEAINEIQYGYPQSTPVHRHLGNAAASIQLAARVLHARGGRNGR